MRAIRATWTSSRYAPSRPVIRPPAISASLGVWMRAGGMSRQPSAIAATAPARKGAATSSASTCRGCLRNGRRHGERALPIGVLPTVMIENSDM
jgi:hypothetical protein